MYEENVSMQKNRKIFMILFAVVVLVSLTVGMVTAAPVTQSINYQGKLTGSGGNALTGTYDVTFGLFDIATGGRALATDTHAVLVTNGLFTTPITFNPSLFDGRALWLGVKVGADTEMTPRQEIRPVPYAISLRPGATIAGSGTTPVLNLTKFDDSGMGLNVITSGGGSHGVKAVTSGTGSHGVWGEATGPASNGVVAISQQSPALWAETFAAGKAAILTRTTKDQSPGYSTNTYGRSSQGVYATTVGNSSHGVFAYTAGDDSNGVAAVTAGVNSCGVYAESNQSFGLYAVTLISDHKYGIYTPDYLYAKGTQVPATDVAEYMPVSVDVTPGTVLVIGEDGKLQTSATAYDTRVAGIVSTEPGVSLGTKEGGNPGEEIIAVAGRVPCKVDATSAPIHAGDLLTTSNNPGYAMKAVPDVINGHKYYPDGTVLGKAMGSLDSGTGTIEVLVTLQ
jgi:hypothetical protein